MKLFRRTDLSTALVRRYGRPSQGGFPFWKSVGLCRSQRKSEAASGSVAWRWPWTRKRIERAMKERDRGFTPLSEVERDQGKPVLHAKLEPGRAYHGRVVAMASDARGRAYVVLNTEPTLTAVPVAEQKLRVGQEIYARAVTQQVAGERQWSLAWQLDDLKQERKRDLGRER